MRLAAVVVAGFDPERTSAFVAVGPDSAFGFVGLAEPNRFSADRVGMVVAVAAAGFDPAWIDPAVVSVADFVVVAVSLPFLASPPAH